MFAILVKRPEFFHAKLTEGDTIEADNLPDLIEGLFPGYNQNQGDESRYAGRVMFLSNIAYNLQAEDFKNYQEETGKDPFDLLDRDEKYALINDKKTEPFEPPIRGWRHPELPLYVVVDTQGENNLPEGNCRFLNAETETLFLRSLAYVDLIEIWEKKTTKTEE